MGHIWTPKPLEAGIDGFIELREDETSHVGACILQVQSKAGPSHFRSESRHEFTFYCDEPDVDYWLRANTPVLLIVSRPENDEGYWVHVQAYFNTPERVASRKIVFNKVLQRFDIHATDQIQRLATPVDKAYHAKVLESTETLWSNLLRLEEYPPRLFRAKTRLKYPESVIERLKGAKEPRYREWLLHGGFIYSFDDLSFDCYTTIRTATNPENLPSKDYTGSSDSDKRYFFVRLLGICLRNLLWRQGVLYSKEHKCFYFRATEELSEQHVGGLSVFKGYFSKLNPDRIVYYRHRACRLELRRIEGDWYVEITPTYHFTNNGTRPSRFYEEALSKIKIAERQNKAHLRQVRLWEEVLNESYIRTPGKAVQRELFDDSELVLAPAIERITKKFGVVRFGNLVKFVANWTVPEKHWLALGRSAEESIEMQMELF